MAVRRAHLVGSIPASTAEEAMRLAVERFGADLDYLPDGETGMRQNWVLSIIEGFLALFTFGPSGPVRHLRPFTEALATVMHQAYRLVGDDVLFQIEVPAEQVALTRAPAAARPALAGLLARRIAALAQGAPEGARFGLHLCLGDMNRRRPLGQLTDASPLVLLANAVADRWPAGRPLRFVHAPLAAAGHPPSSDPAFYAPLAGLRLKPGVRFIAGFAHEEQDLAAQFRIRQLIEDAVGERVDISASCGLGRRPPAAALAAMDRVRLLLSDRPPADAAAAALPGRVTGPRYRAALPGLLPGRVAGPVTGPRCRACYRGSPG